MIKRIWWALGSDRKDGLFNIPNTSFKQLANVDVLYTSIFPRKKDAVEAKRMAEKQYPDTEYRVKKVTIIDV